MKILSPLAPWKRGGRGTGRDRLQPETWKTAQAGFPNLPVGHRIVFTQIGGESHQADPSRRGGRIIRRALPAETLLDTGLDETVQFSKKRVIGFAGFR